jgi:hypothetical protein
MNILKTLRARVPLTPYGWIAAAIGAVLVVALAWFVLASWQASRTASAEAKVGAALGEARGKSAGEAVDIVAAGAGRDAAIDAQTLETDDAIKTAPGAGQAVDPGVHGAGLDGLCRRAAYRGRPECVQRAGAQELPDPGPRR